MSEGKIWREIRDKLSKGPLRLFRNEVGNGVAIRHKHAYTRQAIITACCEMATKMGGSGSRIHFGLTVGSGDLIGLRTVVITPEMIGQKIAVFTSCETKTATGAIREEQANWQRFVNEAGGVAVIARSLEDAENKLQISVDKLLQGADDR